MLEGAKGLIGFISPLSTHICVRCNRLRLTPEGKLRLCLFSDKEIDLKGALRGGASEDEIRQILIKAVQLKPQRASQPKPLRPMSAIGG